MGKRASQFPRKAQRKFLALVLRAETLAGAVSVIRAEAARFPAGAGATSWRGAMVKLAGGLESGTPGFRIMSAKGNKKLPFAYFSSLAIYSCPGAGECASFCYSLKAWQYTGAFCRQLQNTLLLRFNPQLVADAFMSLPQGVTFRLYVDGDFDSARTIAFWFTLLNARPDVRTYGYSKSWDLLAAAGPFPTNYWLNLSSGGRAQQTTAAEMLANPQVRGEFLSIPTDYHAERGFKRYGDREYHRAVMTSARERGIARPFSCPGSCGTCTKLGPACALPQFMGRQIVIGIH